MSYKPIATYGPLATNADNAVVFSLAGNAQEYDTYQIGSTTGAMDVFGSGDGVTFQATPIALVDLTATAPGTLVIETTAAKHYTFRGRYKAIVIQQKGATAVTGAYVIATESA